MKAYRNYAVALLSFPNNKNGGKMESVEKTAISQSKEQLIELNGKKYLLIKEYGDRDLREIIVNLIISDMMVKRKKGA